MMLDAADCGWPNVGIGPEVSVECGPRGSSLFSTSQYMARGEHRLPLPPPSRHRSASAQGSCPLLPPYREVDNHCMPGMKGTKAKFRRRCLATNDEA